jgi:hypothetical protein
MLPFSDSPTPHSRLFSIASLGPNMSRRNDNSGGIGIGTALLIIGLLGGGGSILLWLAGFSPDAITGLV